MMSTTAFDQVLRADDILMALNARLAGTELPQAVRRSNVRLIVMNTCAEDVNFRNPGGHSDKDEVIPPGQAAIIMLKGDTLEAQLINAQALVSTLKLLAGGLANLANAIKNGDAVVASVTKEAYGPASFSEQAEQLIATKWTSADGSCVVVEPVKEDAIAFGARSASKEMVFLITLPADSPYGYVQGTETNAERFYPSAGGKSIAIGVSPVPNEKCRPTGAYTTRPIAPRVAEGFYGESFASIPSIVLNGNGDIVSVHLGKTGTHSKSRT